MEIRSSVDEAVGISEAIISDKDFHLDSAETVSVSGVAVHDCCEQLFGDMVNAMDTYDARVRSDAEFITEIAWELRSLDGDFSDYLHTAGGLMGRA